MKVEFNDIKLRRFFAQMKQVQREKAIRAAVRRVSGQAKRLAVQKFIASGVENSRGIAKGIKSRPFKKTVGFSVKATGYYTSREASKQEKIKNKKAKAVLQWFEDGTAERNSRIHRGRGSGFKGSIAPVKFMARTKEEMTPKVTQAFHEALRLSVQSIAKKNGAK